jgi:dCTP deaminase
MSIQSDRWSREEGIQHGMIEPFSKKQVAIGILSSVQSSHGYDLRVWNEFKIFTDVNSALIDPRAFDGRPFATVQADSVNVPPHLFALAHFVEFFRNLRDVLTICVGKSTYTRCGIASERDAIRAGVGGIRNTGNLQHHAATGQGLRQRGAVPDFVLPLR